MKSVSSRLRRAFFAVFIAIGLIAATTVVAATPASAANTYLWNDVRGSVAVYFAPNEQFSNYINVPNGERAIMRCWLDNAGHRWFYVLTWSHGYGYIVSTWVINQTSVGHC